MKTAVIEVHAFNRRFIDKDNTPFLHGLSKRFGVKDLESVFSHLPLASMWTGAFPDECDAFCDYVYNGDRQGFSKNLPYFLFNLFFNIQRYINGNYYIRNLARNKKTRHFEIKRKKHYFQKNSLGKETFFELLVENGKSFAYYEHPILATNDKSKIVFPIKKENNGRVDYFIKNIYKKDNDFCYLQLRDIDIVGHRHGPSSPEMKSCLRKLDRSLRKLFENMDLEKDNIIVLSGFGLVEVRDYIDLESLLPEFGKGYFYFLDSTTARFWFFDDDKKQEVLDILKNLGCGHILSNEEKAGYRIDKLGREFGEEIFLLERGYCIIPNFYNDDKVKGMHLYDRQSRQEQGFILSNKKISGNPHLLDILPTLCKTARIKCHRKEGSPLF